MRVVVATDRSSTAEAAVAWAAQLARHEHGELVLLQVVPASTNGAGTETDLAALQESLSERARELAGERGTAIVAVARSRRARSSTRRWRRPRTCWSSATPAWRVARSSCSATCPTASRTPRGARS